MIDFVFENINELDLDLDAIEAWIKFTIEQQNLYVGDITYIFCNDDYILDINQKFLDHNYFTDIITFNYNENKTVNGDIFISVDTVSVNAKYYKECLFKELLRVIIHGVLHLVGFDDVNDHLQNEMTRMENNSLKIFYQEFNNK